MTKEELESHWLIRLDGECTVSSAAELKTLLLDGLASGKGLRLDLEGAEDIDIAVMQLLYAGGREADRRGAGIEIRYSEAAGMAARDAGFEGFPGLAGGGWPR